MTPEAEKWMDGLCERSDQCRRTTPIPDVHGLDVAEEAQHQLLGGLLVEWLKSELPRFLFERSEFVATMRGIDKEPGLVVTTSPIGLIAAKNIMGDRRPFCVYLLEDEYRSWCDENPAPKWRWHIHHWSWIETDVVPESVSCRSEFPLAAGETYWIHHAGVSVADLFERSYKHLWKWTHGGARPELLKPYMEEVVS